VAVDAVMDSVSVRTTFRETLAELGIIFCSFSEAVREYPDLVKRYMGTVVPYTDNFFATLNSAVFSDGSFCYIPKGVRCPRNCRLISGSMQPTQVSSSATLLVAAGEYGSY
jgi:Fe-S cluster assembly protein SufB